MRTRGIILLSFFLLIFEARNLIAQQLNNNIPNPVLPGVRDVGAFKYNGEYYLGGMNTNGGFYISQDMVNWRGPVHVFSMDNDWTSENSADDSQIHAGDISYTNGTFHFYWSVNYWGTAIPTVHVGHAVSQHLLGPYSEPDKTTWLTNRIDPHLFIDDDRKQYLYTVKFTDGNTIWGNALINPGKLSDESRYLFAALPNTWETYDNKVAEGPWVIKYRSQYYMMYNANHTAPQYGNYGLGAAVSDHPLAFNNGNKYPFPLVESNQVYLEDNFIDILRYGHDGPTMLYTFHKPDDNWMKSDYKSDQWMQGPPAFGSRKIENSATRKTITTWQSDEVWVRKDFNVDRNSDNHMLRINHDGKTEVYINGFMVYQDEGRNYTTWNFDEKTKSYLKPGTNTIAVHSRKNGESNFLDFSLFDMEDTKADDILYVSGQPSIVKGPNGFEWWMVYFTMKNGGGPGQFINRVLFFDKQMYVDGPTASNSLGFHPLPAPATFQDNFTDSRLDNTWKPLTGRWTVHNTELLVEGNEGNEIMIDEFASHYLFEVNLKLGNAQSAGVYAYWKDPKNRLKIELDRSRGWTYNLMENGKTTTVSTPLFDEFDFDAYHALTIKKNGDSFQVAIDHLPAPGSASITANFTEKGQCGLSSGEAGAIFDGVLYTKGWDEFDQGITGWETSINSSPENTGNWKVSQQGLEQNSENGIFQTFKGDFLKTYDFSLQVDKNNLTTGGKAGAFPIYVDDKNFLLTHVDFEKQTFVIQGKRNGKVVVDKVIPLLSRRALFADRSTSDFSETHFTFQEEGIIDAIEFYKKPHFKRDTIIENIPDLLKISYKRDDKWIPLTVYKKVEASHPAFARINFPAIQTNEVRLEHKRDQDLVYKVFINERIKAGYNLRFSRTSGEIVIMVDGKELLKLTDSWPAAQVGLITENCKARYNGILLYHLPEKD